MAEKGGKGNLPVKGGKSALKSPVGNGDSSGKSKKGKKVQFDSEDSIETNTPKSNGKAHTSDATGGKGGKTANGTKNPTGKGPTPGERRLEQDCSFFLTKRNDYQCVELPPNSVCLMDCEAAEILQSIQDQMVILSQDPDIKLPVSFDTGLTYAKRGGSYAKPETVKKIFEYPHLYIYYFSYPCMSEIIDIYLLVYPFKNCLSLTQSRPLKKHGVSDCEICLIANICPESVDEVFAVVPALKPKVSKLKDPLRIALDELANLKEALANLKNST